LASVHLLSAAPADSDADSKAFLDLEQMLASAQADSFGVHRVVDDPAAADLILFVETSGAAGYYFERVRRHPLYREFGPKCYLFSSTDRVVPFLPGVFASVERRWYWPSWTRSGHYLGVSERPDLSYDPDASPSRLFSFIGAGAAHPARARILALSHPEAILFDSSVEDAEVAAGEKQAPSPEEYVARYLRSVLDSAFVLCPRGGGTSSFRLFEAMMLGRVPVIVSDQWVAPEGLDWDAFSLRVDEARVEEIPSLLEARRGEAAAMGEAARAAWLEWFSPAAGFHRTVERCLDLAGRAPARRGIRGYAPHLQMLRPYHAARSVLKRAGR
jgi:hypothetical protein